MGRSSLSTLNFLCGRRFPAVDLSPNLSVSTTRSRGAGALPIRTPNRQRACAMTLSLFLLASVFVMQDVRSVQAAGIITFRGAASASNGGTRAVKVPKPPAARPGDLMIASVVFSRWPKVMAPDGWSLIRRNAHAYLYYRFATEIEPPFYAWTFSRRSRAVGVIVAYSGVTQPPVDVAGGKWNRLRSDSVRASSITIRVPGAKVIGVFGMLVRSKLTRPRGMTERARVMGGPMTAVSVLVADMYRPGPGPTGFKVARASRVQRNVGQLVALSPSVTPPPPPPPPPGDPYRAFSNDSYWNTPLPSNAPIDRKSKDYIAYLKRNPVGNFVMLSGADRDGQWGTPIYWAKTSDPTYNVKSHRYYVPPEFGALRIPRGARPDPTPDGEMMIYDLNRGYVAALWQARYDPYSNSWTAGGGDIFYVASNGLDGRLPESNEPRNTGAHRGAAPPIFAVRFDEIQAGSIRHVLKVAIPNPRSMFVFPMTGSDGRSNELNAPPEGARFRLKPSIDLKSMKLTPAQYAVAKAAQDYGFVVTDASGAPVATGLENVVAEGRGWLWSGILAWDSLRVFPLDAYQFIENGYGR
jgi:hypothetical protein